MKDPQHIEIDGKRYVVVEEDRYRRLVDLSELPPLPTADRRGNYPAIEYARASIARSIILERKSLGLSQQQLARLAGVRQETISRLESGKHTATPRTVEKIDKALTKAAKRRKRTG